ncbi:MAG: prepilin-type N-terminal cleavage/methylation domain-containing protein [Vagococcus sp.]|uniref:pilus assembly FimT family protein n=1 Tax=Vagococcus TaxID=2737 RepID=UPI002FC9773F
MKKMKQIMKDEEGLTLVELLAVVVIMAIIAGIAAVSISKLIQRTREDAQVTNVRQMIDSANLYDIQEENGLDTTTTLTTLKEEGVIKSTSFVAEGKEAEFEFKKNVKSGEISVVIPAAGLMAGQKPNEGITVTEDQAANLTRDDLYNKKANESK